MCTHENTTWVCGSLTCLECGEVLEDFQVVHSFNSHMSSEPIGSCYSRSSRFKRNLRYLNILHTAPIMQMFFKIEGSWNCNVSLRRKRCYFLSLKVVLFFIQNKLGQPLSHPTPMKDKRRLAKQLSILGDLLKA